MAGAGASGSSGLAAPLSASTSAGLLPFAVLAPFLSVPVASVLPRVIRAVVARVCARVARGVAVAHERTARSGRERDALAGLDSAVTGAIALAREQHL